MRDTVILDTPLYKDSRQANIPSNDMMNYNKTKHTELSSLSQYYFPSAHGEWHGRMTNEFEGRTDRTAANAVLPLSEAIAHTTDELIEQMIVPRNSYKDVFQLSNKERSFGYLNKGSIQQPLDNRVVLMTRHHDINNNELFKRNMDPVTCTSSPHIFDSTIQFGHNTKYDTFNVMSPRTNNELFVHSQPLLTTSLRIFSHNYTNPLDLPRETRTSKTQTTPSSPSLFNMNTNINIINNTQNIKDWKQTFQENKHSLHDYSQSEQDRLDLLIRTTTMIPLYEGHQIGIDTTSSS
jgi:hypothetical protein